MQRPPSLRSAPSGPSLSLVRCPPRFAQGTNQRSLLGLGSRSRTTVVPVCELESASGRRLAPYPSVASDGGRKCVVHPRKPRQFANQFNTFATADAFSGGRPSTQCEKGGRSHNTSSQSCNGLLRTPSYATASGDKLTPTTPRTTLPCSHRGAPRWQRGRG